MLKFLHSSQKHAAPYRDTSLNICYNLLFCDDILLYKKHSETMDTYPWNILFSRHGDEKELHRIIDDDDAESRAKLLAYRILNRNKVSITAGIVLGVIVESALENGLDTLAIFKDHTTRYINFSEKSALWKTYDNCLDQKIDDLYKYSEIVVKNLDPWGKDRLPHPQKGNVRITFLVSNGIYTGESSAEAISCNEMSSTIFYLAHDILKYLQKQS